MRRLETALERAIETAFERLGRRLHPHPVEPCAGPSLGGAAHNPGALPEDYQAYYRQHLFGKR